MEENKKRKISLDLSPIAEAVLKAAKKSKKFKAGFSAQGYINYLLEEVGVTNVQMQDVDIDDIREMQATIDAEKNKAVLKKAIELIEKIN